ncbi:MAG TPA: hypothetical protein VFU80_03690 [Sphingomicrobium sp.]|nr:hypothetical protein [Sphingomicrobium sp.]
MLRSLLALSAFALVTTPAAAATYRAKPVAPVSESRIVARDVLWTCGAVSCVGSTQTGRPLVVCQSLAKKTGELASFTVEGRPIAAAELDRCNASAGATKASDSSALANAR